MRKSDHYRSVEAFMRLAKQDCPDRPTEPTEAVRLLRAKLIFEEAMETINKGLGVYVGVPYVSPDEGDVVPVEKPEFRISGPFDMIETVDGCCDVAVVTTGTLIACGVPNIAFQEAVDQNNLDKFGEGHTFREDGKLIKPPGHQPPDIAGLLRDLAK